MIKIENMEVQGFSPALRGMRNPKNSWGRADSVINGRDIKLGENDTVLALHLAGAGPVHGKFRRMIVVYADITAPLYWWKEFDTYKVGTVANSCSTMHKLASRDLTIEDFSTDYLDDYGFQIMNKTIEEINSCRDTYVNWDKYPDLHQIDRKHFWEQMIQLLPFSYNQKRTVMLNYEVLANIYKYRRGHKLREWRDFIQKMSALPYWNIITADTDKEQKG